MVKRIEEQETTRHGIVIPDSAKEKPQESEVMAIGKGERLDDGQMVALAVKVTLGPRSKSERRGSASCSTPFAGWNMGLASSGGPSRGDRWPVVRLGEIRPVHVCLDELARDAGAAAASPGKIKPDTAAEDEQVTRLLIEALRESGYINPLTAASTEEKVRRLVRRLEIPARDVPVLLGMLRQILWKLRP